MLTFGQKTGPIALPDDASLEVELRNIAAKFEDKETEENWNARDAALARFRQIIIGSSGLPGFISIVKKHMNKPLISALSSDRTRYARTALTVVETLSDALKERFEAFSETYLGKVLNTFAVKANKVYVSSGLQTLTHCIMTSKIANFIPYLAEAHKNLSKSLKETAAQALLTTLEVNDRQRLDPYVKHIEIAISAGVTDSVLLVRETSKESFEKYTQLFPERLESFSLSISDTARKYLKLEAPKSRPSSVRKSVVEASHIDKPRRILHKPSRIAISGVGELQKEPETLFMGGAQRVPREAIKSKAKAIRVAVSTAVTPKAPEARKPRSLATTNAKKAPSTKALGFVVADATKNKDWNVRARAFQEIADVWFEASSLATILPAIIAGLADNHFKVVESALGAALVIVEEYSGDQGKELLIQLLPRVTALAFSSQQKAKASIKDPAMQILHVVRMKFGEDMVLSSVIQALSKPACANNVLFRGLISYLKGLDWTYSVNKRDAKALHTRLRAALGDADTIMKKEIHELRAQMLAAGRDLVSPTRSERTIMSSLASPTSPLTLTSVASPTSSTSPTSPTPSHGPKWGSPCTTSAITPKKPPTPPRGPKSDSQLPRSPTSTMPLKISPTPSGMKSGSRLPVSPRTGLLTPSPHAAASAEPPTLRTPSPARTSPEKANDFMTSRLRRPASCLVLKTNPVATELRKVRSAPLIQLSPKELEQKKGVKDVIDKIYESFDNGTEVAENLGQLKHLLETKFDEVILKKGEKDGMLPGVHFFIDLAQRPINGQFNFNTLHKITNALGEVLQTFTDKADSELAWATAVAATQNGVPEHYCMALLQKGMDAKHDGHDEVVAAFLTKYLGTNQLNM